MAALGAMPLSQAMGRLEDRAAGVGDQSSSHSFSDPHAAQLAYQRAYFNPKIIFVFILSIAIPTIYIYLYVGALFNPQSRLHNVLVHIINLDQGINRTSLITSNNLNATGQSTLAQLLPVDNVGQYLSYTLLTSSSTAGLFAWRYYEASNSSLQSLDAVVDKVAAGDAEQWYTLVILPNYTSNYVEQAINVYTLSQLNDDFYSLSQAGLLPSPLNGSYDNPIYEVWDQGRNYAVNSFVTSALNSAMTGLQAATTASVYKSVAVLPAGTSYLKASFLLTPLPTDSINTHPVTYYGLNFFTYLCSLVLWIGGIITLTVVVKWSQGVEDRFFSTAAEYSSQLRAGSALFIRFVMISCIGAVQAALVFSVIPALGGGDAIVYGHGRCFVWLWYSAFTYLAVLGSVMALVGPDVFQIPATLWLILQLTASGAFMDQILQPGFYQIGRAFPLYYTIRGMRTIVFGSYYHIEEDALVLFGWSVGSLIIIALAGTNRVDKRWKTLRESDVVHALRDTTGFSASTSRFPNLEKEKEKEAGLVPQSPVRMVRDEEKSVEVMKVNVQPNDSTVVVG